MTTLRALDAGDEMPDIVRSRSLTLVRVRAGEMEFAVDRWEKREWLEDRQTNDVLGVVWTGKWRSDVFELPAEFEIN